MRVARELRAELRPQIDSCSESIAAAHDTVIYISYISIDFSDTLRDLYLRADTDLKRTV